MEQTPQQLPLIETAFPVICAHCASTRAVVLRDREIIDGRFGDYPGWSEAPCCTPDSDYRCPQCNGGRLQFAMRYASAEGEETGEVYRCEACGATGDVEDAAPSVEPWAELEAVAEGGFWVMGSWQTLEPTAISQQSVPFIKEVA
jgi:hypothetical protein